MGTNHVSGIPTIEDPDEEGLGPAMLALTLAQRRFVMAMVTIGGTQKSCYVAAGYSNTSDSSACTSATQLAGKPKIQAAMLEVGIGLLGAARIPAAKFLIDTIKNESVEMKDRLKATEMIMNRTGMHATSEHKVAVTHKDESSDELVKQITLMAKSLGVNPSKLLGGKTIEVDFEEVVFDENSIEDLL